MTRQKPNYELKAKVLKNGYCDMQRKVALTTYILDRQIKKSLASGEIVELKKPLSMQELELYDMIARKNSIEWKEAERVNQAYYKRNQRLKEKIKNMLLSGQCIFLTLTFKNDVLNSTTSETRHRYVARALKAMATQYIANIDYGKKNEREHYHAIVLCETVSHKQWKYGNIDFKRVRVEQDDSVIKLSKYINKLTNHAIKETTKQNRLIYSRL